MCRFAAAGLVIGLLAVLAPLASGQLGYKKDVEEHAVHDPCESVVCTTGKDGRRTFCRVVHVCDKPDDTGDCVCNFTLPVCVSKASSDSYYDYGTDKSVCKRGSPVIKLDGKVKECNETDDCPMGYECVDAQYGNPIRNGDTEGVCCLEEKKMKKPPTCPKVPPKSFKSTSKYYGNSYYNPINICMTKCYSNYDCDYDEICCYTGCGYVCVDPEGKKTTTTTTSTTTTTAAPTTTTTMAPIVNPLVIERTDTEEPVASGPIVLSGNSQDSVASNSGDRVGNFVLYQDTDTTSTTTATAPTYRSIALKDHPKCPADPAEVICGQLMCYSDKDCDYGEVCCDSKTCQNSNNPGTACIKIKIDKPPTKKPTHLNPFLSQPHFGGFNNFGTPFYKPQSDSNSHYELPTFPEKKKDPQPYGFPSFGSGKSSYGFLGPSFGKATFPSLSGSLYNRPGSGFDKFGKSSEYHNMDPDSYNTVDKDGYKHADAMEYAQMDGYDAMEGYEDDSKYPVDGGFVLGRK